MFIFHFLPKSNWVDNSTTDYSHDSISTEGFIHCSFLNQILPSAHKHAKGHDQLVLLKIDTDKIKAPLKFENTSGGTEDYPHIYGLLNRDAITAIFPLNRDSNGLFSLPNELL